VVLIAVGARGEGGGGRMPRDGRGWGWGGGGKGVRWGPLAGGWGEGQNRKQKKTYGNAREWLAKSSRG